MASVSITMGIIVADQPRYQGSGSVPTNQCSLSDLIRVFGTKFRADGSVKLSDYYSDGVLISKTPPTSANQNGPIPATGQISLGKFLGTTNLYSGNIPYPGVATPGWWRFYLPKLPSGWTTATLTGKLIGGGGGGGGGWGNGAPNGDTPVASGGGGGSGIEVTIATTLSTAQLTLNNAQSISESSFLEAYIGAAGGRSWSSSDWQNGGNTDTHPAAWGEASLLRMTPRYGTGSPTTNTLLNPSGGEGGQGGSWQSCNAGYTAGGWPNGGNGQVSRGVGGDRTGGAGGGNSLGAGGYGGWGGDIWGGNSPTPGGGGGGGGAKDVNADLGYGAPGGDGAAGYIQFNIVRGT